MSMFDRFSALIECSTGRTPTVAALKTMISQLAAFGYRELYLGLTDAYKIEGEPYFNYKRGGYSTADLNELDAFAKEHGIELIANIQTLGHLHYLQRHESYRDLMDNDNILMVGDERVYALVDKMFAAISAGLSTRKIHIGFDECWGLGLGNYLKKFGPADKKELLLRHLKRVVEISRKYGFVTQIWHDMLIETDNTRVTPEEVRAALPEDVTVWFWDYFEKDEQKLNDKLDQFLRHAEKTGYAGSAIKCGSMAPMNTFSMARLVPQMRAAKAKKMNAFMVTLWSDNGAWVENASVLPTLYAAAELNNGTWDGVGPLNKERFRAITGCDYDDLLLLDALDDPFDRRMTDSHGNRSYWLMLTDLLNGGWDLLLNEKTGEAYENLADRFAAIVRSGRNEPMNPLFLEAEKLARVLAIKAGLGIRIRSSYKNKDNGALNHCFGKLQDLQMALKEYQNVHNETWLKSSMPFGLEVDQLFLGGQMARIAYIETRLRAFLEDGTPITELDDETKLPDLPSGTTEDNFWNSDWRVLFTNCGT